MSCDEGIEGHLCYCFSASQQHLCSFKARLHRRFLSQQLNAIFVALKLQLQNLRCKPGAICRRNITGVSTLFET